MKLVALFAIALAAACSSSDIVDNRSLNCESGQDIEVRVGIDGASYVEGREDRFDLMVEVANNSHGEVTVDFIRIEQPSDSGARYRIESSYRKFGQLIEEGKDHTFALPTSGQPLSVDPRMVRSSGGTVIYVHVGLTNGDLYRCSFSLDAPR